ncbi:MAG: flavodoxin family protein [Microgenomates group bacterium]
MKFPRVLIIYKSVHHQNTLKIAKILGKELKAELKEAGQFNSLSLKNYDLVGFGSGIYFWQHHRQLLELVDRLKFSKDQKVFIFSTSGVSLGKIFHRKLRRKLINKGCKVIGEFNCLGWDSFGILKFFGGINKNHPNQKDFQNARHFAKNLLTEYFKK